MRERSIITLRRCEFYQLLPPIRSCEHVRSLGLLDRHTYIHIYTHNADKSTLYVECLQCYLRSMSRTATCILTNFTRRRIDKNTLSRSVLGGRNISLDVYNRGDDCFGANGSIFFFTRLFSVQRAWISMAKKSNPTTTTTKRDPNTSRII